MVVPILPGKLERTKEFLKELQGDRKQAFNALAKQGGLSRVRNWIQPTPQGDLMVVVHEGPDPEKWMPTMMESEEPAAQWFREMLKEIHGMDPTGGPPPPPAELLADTVID